MYELFDEQVKEVVDNLQNNAILNKEYIIGTEYLLIELLRDDENFPSRILSPYNVNLEEIENKISTFYIFRKNVKGIISFTDELKEILILAFNVMSTTKDKEIAIEHLFFALLEHPENVAKYILMDLEICIEEIQYDIISTLDWDIDFIDSFSEESDTENHSHEVDDDENEEDDDEDDEEEDYPTKSLDGFSYVINITKKAQNGSLMPLIGRVDELQHLEKTMRRKIKNNSVIVGSAGVGKTALVEGLAQKYLTEKSKNIIIQLDINALVAGTKYRGDFEKKLDRFLNEIKKDKNKIIFIDEIHTIVGAGKGEGSLDVANILKPVLASGDVRFIGATTSEEYWLHIANDKALARRFEPVFLKEPDINETNEILEGVKNTFEKFHNIKIPLKIIPEIIKEADIKYRNRKFPDKAIDLLDDLCVETVFMDKKTCTIDLLHKITRPSKSTISNFNNLVFESLNIHYKKHFLGVRNYDRNILNIYVTNYNEEEKNNLVDTLCNGFNISTEALIELDSNDYYDQHSISSLIGSPPGYVGYNQGGELTEHLKKYPISVVLIKNYQQSVLGQLVNKIFTHWNLKDAKGLKIDCQNTIFIISSAENEKVVGFNKSQFSDINLPSIIKENIDEVISFENIIDSNKRFKYINQYITKINTLGYNCTVNESLSNDIEKEQISYKDIDQLFNNLFKSINNANEYIILLKNKELTYEKK